METLMGAETEYSATFIDPQGKRIDPDQGGAALLALVRRHLRCLQSCSGQAWDLFAENGGRLYLDIGPHCEYSTPECPDPTSLVCHLGGGHRLMGRLAAELPAAYPHIAEAIVTASTVSYPNRETSGSHESYLHRGYPECLPATMVPHLVSRLIYTGGGGFNPFNPGLEFMLSPRAAFLRTVCSEDSVHGRGIWHSRQRPLAADGWQRAHVIAGDHVCSEQSNYLRFGTTCLVVLMAARAVDVGGPVAPRAPVEAMQTFAGDPTCQAAVRVADGRHLRAIDIQRHYLAEAQRYLGESWMPEWALDLCIAWGAILDRLETAPDSVARTLDWAIKYRLYNDRLRRLDLPPLGSEEWTCRPGAGSVPDFGGGDAPSEPDSAPQDPDASGAAPPVSEIVQAVIARQRARRLHLPARHEAARNQLMAADTMFGRVGGAGVFSALDARGVLDHRIVADTEIEQAVWSPPRFGRARTRAAEIRRLAPWGVRYACTWHSILDTETGHWMNLSDPFATKGTWVEEDDIPF